VNAQDTTQVDKNAQKIDALKEKLENIKKANSEVKKEDGETVSPSVIHRLQVLDNDIKALTREIEMLEALVHQMTSQEQRLIRIEDKLDKLITQGVKVESIVSSNVSTSTNTTHKTNTHSSTNKVSKSSNSHTKEGNFYIVLEAQRTIADAKQAQQMLSKKGITVILVKNNAWHFLVLDKIYSYQETIAEINSYHTQGYKGTWRVLEGSVQK
jgi:uncharacterized coiled-coil protein SlyX